MLPRDSPVGTGCILFELATGRLLYDTHDNLEHIDMMAATLGPIPASDWAARCMDEAKPLFDATGLKTCPTSSRLSRLSSMESMIPDELMVSLIRGCLNYDQGRRLSARQVMMHPFVTRHVPESMHAQLNSTPCAPYTNDKSNFFFF